MEMNEAELNSACLHRSWEERQIRESILMAMNEVELNAFCLQQVETDAYHIR